MKQHLISFAVTVVAVAVGVVFVAPQLARVVAPKA